jgi:hypothetical protein
VRLPFPSFRPRTRDEWAMAMLSDAPGRAWPKSAAALGAAIGYGPWASAWQCDEASGDLADSIGAITLADVTAPTYRNTGAIPGDYAVGFAAGIEDSFRAGSTGTFDLNDVTSLAFYVCMRATTSANRPFFGKVHGTNAWGAQMGAAAGQPEIMVKSGATTVTSAIAVAHHDSLFHDYIGCIDRTGQRIQLFTDLGTSTEADISAVPTLTTATFFFIGAQQFSNMFAAQVAYAAICTAGVDTLRANGAAAIANIRRATGRS